VPVCAVSEAQHLKIESALIRMKVTSLSVRARPHGTRERRGCARPLPRSSADTWPDGGSARSAPETISAQGFTLPRARRISDISCESGPSLCEPPGELRWRAPWPPADEKLPRNRRHTLRALPPPRRRAAAPPRRRNAQARLGRFSLFRPDARGAGILLIDTFPPPPDVSS